MLRRLLPKAFATIAALALPLAPAAADGAPAPERAPLGLFTTLPIYWPEAPGLAELIASEAAPHWARTALERDYALVPLDTLGGEGGALDRFGRLLLAQPRTLSPAENVALDSWVRGGGHLLLFADPMLTAESIFAFGDKRRPQDVALLSPILARWGLELQFDDAQPPDETEVAVDGVAMPVRLRGRLASRAADSATCDVLADGLVARCDVGAGQVTVVADAALLEGPEATPQRAAALDALLVGAFGRP